MKSAPILSLITGTRNRPDSLNQLINSIKLHTYVDWEMIIGDASDTPIDQSGFDSRFAVLFENPRKGYSAGYNQAVSIALGKFVIWLNDDAEVVEGYDRAAIAFMEAHPQIGLGALYYREGARDFHINSYFGIPYANFGIMDREFFNQIGGFDEDLPMYGSDNAIAFKVLLAGKGIAGIPDARIIHYATDDEERRENGNYERRRMDAEILAEKYGPLMAEMQATYARFANGVSGNDQTPDWLRDKVSG